jgi:hypothetical protein
MADTCNGLTARQAQGQRGLFILANSQFVKTAVEKYAEVKDNDEYTAGGTIQKAIPKAIEYTGTSATNTFTVTGVDVTEEFPAGHYVALYTKADFDAIDNYTTDTTLKWYKVESSAFTTDTAVVLNATIEGTPDTAVPFESRWQEVWGISEVGFDFGSADITTDTNLSGAVATNLPGKITANPSLSGFYMPNLPSQVQLERLMFNVGCPVQAIIPRGRGANEVFYQGSFLVKTFSDGGMIDGTSAQTLTGEMQAKNAGVWKQFVTALDFETAKTIKEY